MISKSVCGCDITNVVAHIFVHVLILYFTTTICSQLTRLKVKYDNEYVQKVVNKLQQEEVLLLYYRAH